MKNTASTILKAILNSIPLEYVLVEVLNPYIISGLIKLKKSNPLLLKSITPTIQKLHDDLEMFL